VLYFGVHMRRLETPGFVPAAVGVIAVLTLGAMTLERAVNADEPDPSSSHPHGRTAGASNVMPRARHIR